MTLVVGCSTTDSGTMSAGGITYALNSEGFKTLLDDANPGDTIHLDADGEFIGTFNIPSGVQIEGNGAQIQATNSAALILNAITGDNTIRNLSINSEMGGIVAFEGNSAAHLVLENVTVTVERGFGIATENLNLSITNVAIQGPISGPDDLT